MSLPVSIFYPELSRLAGGSDEVRVDGATVGECLADLTRRYPGVERLLFDRRGKLLKPVYVFVNAEGMAKADMCRPVTDNDKLIVAVLATGG
ncbi:MAG: molybdopterin synthase sulfur carrier subunit [Thermoleophilia bacterium]|nr:molybdopterin synthase sulfur carrier subunit [Thermoleophilia bacterium]